MMMVILPAISMLYQLLLVEVLVWLIECLQTNLAQLHRTMFQTKVLLISKTHLKLVKP